jgi:hypothetical protein
MFPHILWNRTLNPQESYEAYWQRIASSIPLSDPIVSWSKKYLYKTRLLNLNSVIERTFSISRSAHSFLSHIRSRTFHCTCIYIYIYIRTHTTVFCIVGALARGLVPRYKTGALCKCKYRLHFYCEILKVMLYDVISLLSLCCKQKKGLLLRAGTCEQLFLLQQTVVNSFF